MLEEELIPVWLLLAPLKRAEDITKGCLPALSLWLLVLLLLMLLIMLL